MFSLCVSRHANDANDAWHGNATDSCRSSACGSGDSCLTGEEGAQAEDYIRACAACQDVQQAQSGWHHVALPGSGLSWGSMICMYVYLSLYIYREREISSRCASLAQQWLELANL